MSYAKRACAVSEWDGECNERKYKRVGISVAEKGVDCGLA